MSTWAEPNPEAARSGDWADPAFFSHRLQKGDRFWRLVWKMILPVEGNRIIPTPAGYALILVSLGLGTAAYNTASNILFMALSLLLSSFILSGLLSWWNFRGTRWRLNLPAYFRVGETADLHIELSNTKHLLPTYNLWFNIRSTRAGQQERIYLDERLNPGEVTRLGWNFRPLLRGEDNIAIAGLESQFPFGFLRKVVGGSLRRDIIVFPGRIEYTFQPPSGHHAHRKGELSRRPGSGAELINIRRYQEGDPQRLVHWKASARLRRLMVRQMAEDNRDGYIVFVETPSSLWGNAEALEKLCAFACSLAEDLFLESRLIGVAVNDEPLVSVKRLHDLHSFFEVMARLETVEQPQVSPDVTGPNLITFRPGGGKTVNAFIAGNLAGTA